MMWIRYGFSSYLNIFQHTCFTYIAAIHYNGLWITHNTLENNYIYIAAATGRALVRVLFLFFFCFNFFSVSFLLSLTVLIVCRFFPHTHTHSQSHQPNRVSVSIHVFFSISLYCSFTHSLILSFLRFVQRTDLIKFTITFEMFNLHMCMWTHEINPACLQTHNCVIHTHIKKTIHNIFRVCVRICLHHWSFLWLKFKAI